MRRIIKDSIMAILMVSFVLAYHNSLSVRQYFNEDDPCYNHGAISFSPQSSAIVLIDLWDREVVTPLIEMKLLELIKIARASGILIIHAPSQRYNIIHPLISVHPDDILITGYDDLGEVLEANEITTLLYAGNDVMKCVLDKPLGAIHHSLDNNQYNYVLIRDGVTSAYEETQLLGINIFEKLFSNTTTIFDISYAVGQGVQQGTHQDIALPKYSKRKSKQVEGLLYAQESAIVVIQPLKFESKNHNSLVDVISWADSLGIMIINFESDEQPSYVPGSNSLSTEKEMIKLIRLNDLRNLVYIGSAIDEEMLWGELGILRMHIQRRYKNNPMPECFVVSDYSGFSNKPLAISEDVAKEVLLNEYRDINRISFNELRAVFKEGGRDTDATKDYFQRVLLRIFPSHRIDLQKAFDRGQLWFVLRELYVWMYVYKWALIILAVAFTSIGYIGKYNINKITRRNAKRLTSKIYEGDVQ